MLFDVDAVLAEILATPCDTRDNRDKPPEMPPLSRVSQLSQGMAPETEIRPPAPCPSHGDWEQIGKPARRAEPEGFPYGFTVNGYPLTWTGRPVSPETWAGLTPWERHGSNGKLWNGLTRQWEPIEVPSREQGETFPSP